MTRYPFAFDPRFRWPLRLLGVRSDRAHVAVTDTHLEARFGPWLVRTPVTNIDEVAVTGPHHPLRAIGPRFSPSTRSLTFGSNAERTVRVGFHQPVAGLEPFGIVRHPTLSLSVAEPAALRDHLREVAALG